MSAPFSRIYAMLQSVPHLFFLVFLLGSIQSRRLESRDLPSSNRNIYRNLQARIVPVVSSSTTRVHPSRKVQPATRILGKRQSTVTSRISAALNTLLQTVDAESTNIKSYASQGSSPDTIFSQVKGPLENILKAAQQALTDVKNCEYAPAPSSGFQSPPSSPCSLILEIIRCLKNLISSLLSVMDPTYVKGNLGDIFSQITGAVAQIIFEVASKVPGTINDLTQIGSDVLDSIRSIGYGFDDILNVLKPQ